MKLVFDSYACRTFFPCAAASFLLFSIALEARASDPQWVTREGRKIALTKSTTESAVELRSYDDTADCARRLAAAGHGKLENIKSAPEARFKLLKTPSATVFSRDRIRQDPAVTDLRPVYRYTDSGALAVSSGTIAVRVREGLSDEERAGVWDTFRLKEMRAVNGLKGVYIVQPADPDEDEVAIAELLADDRRTVWANPNFRREYQIAQASVDDEFFHLQWHLENTAQSGGAVGADIDALGAWDLGTGVGIRIGMLDDSCDVDHEDLRDNYLGIGQDITLPFFDADYSNPRPKLASDAHGTAVMGLAVASANSVGVRGVAYGAKFTATRGLGFTTDEQTASAYIFALDQKVDIHNNSWGYGGPIPTPSIVEEAIVQAFNEGRDPDGPGGQPPLGMVIFFASGNENSDVRAGIGLASIPEVIAVGASLPDDRRASFSNFGAPLAFLAPGGENANLGITTTDTTDSPVADGYNVGGQGVNPDTGELYGPDIDGQGKYTGFFGGTSAACPIAAGVAGLILSINPNLTATNVRLLMEHTCDAVHPEDAAYDLSTGHSLKYGYGRLNAARAAQAAKDSLTNGNRAWPAVPSGVGTTGTTLSWTTSKGTDEFLVLESQNVVGFVATDGLCYAEGQKNCAAGPLTELPAGVDVLFAGCNGSCEAATLNGVEFAPPSGQIKLLFVFARDSTTGRYSFGAKAEAHKTPPPSVTIIASPLIGDSPLTVHFKGNATSTMPIDEARTVWDFDINQPPVADAVTREATRVYEVPDGQTQTIIARLTMYDSAGTPGSEEVTIRVNGKGFDQGGGGTNGGSLQIVVGLPSTPETDTSTGTSPFEVLLSVNTSGLPGTYQSIYWDLGDGTSDTSLVVPHTYTNEGTTDLRIPITATLTTSTSQSTTVSTTATRIITVKPGLPPVNGGGAGTCEIPGTCASGPGGSAGPCGAGFGMIPLLFTVFTLVGMRRRSA